MEIGTSNLSLQKHTFIVKENEANQRIDKYLTLVLPIYSRSYFQQLIADGHITINDITAKSSTVVKTDDTIKVTLPAPVIRPQFQPVNTNLGVTIIFEHPHFFIINKPAGLLVHQTEVHTNEPTLIDWLLTNYHELASIGPSERPGTVHRLDKDTSGLMIIARTNYAHMQFTNLFQSRAIKKTYLAIVQGHPPSSGSINLAIARDPSNRKKMRAFPVPDPSIALTSDQRTSSSTHRNALTHYTVQTYFKDYSLVKAEPVTGRTHQIRVHFAAIGHPLLGDSVYGIPSKIITRQALHAAQLAFTFDNENYIFTAEAPEDFKNILALLA